LRKERVSVGVVTDREVYLDPSASDRVFRDAIVGKRLGVSSQALRHRLHRQGLLASVDVSRHTLLVRRILGGRQRLVLHLKSSDLAPADLLGIGAGALRG
jgi:hypothetical protein